MNNGTNNNNSLRIGDGGEGIGTGGVDSNSLRNLGGSGFNTGLSNGSFNSTTGIENLTNSMNFGDSFREFIGGNVANVFGNGVGNMGGGSGGGSGGGGNGGPSGLGGSFAGGIGVGGVGGNNSFSNHGSSGGFSGVGGADICGGGIGGILNSFNNGPAETATNLTPINHVIAHQTNFNEQLVDEQRQKQQTMYQGSLRPLNNTSNSNSNSNNNNYNNNNIDVDNTNDDGQDVISDLSRRVNNLSVTERQQAQNDVYGFRLNHHNEDPVQLNLWMDQMDRCIVRGTSGNDQLYSALRLAMHSNSNSNGVEYVKSQRLKFLRSADWRVEEAVCRLARHFTLKLEHFGSKLLTKDLTLRDLPSQDLILWRRYGFVQLSEERDAYGRAILVFIGKQQLPLPVETVIRVLLYLTTILTKDETIQKTGCIQLHWGHGQDFIVDRRATKVVELFRAIPLRGVGKHLCYANTNMQRVFAIVARYAITWGAVRTRAHQGTMMECAYNLMTYGIPRNAIPVNDDGDVELEFFHCFLDAIEKRENAEYERKLLQQQQNSLSWNMSSSDPIDPFSLSNGNLEELPDDFMNKIANLQSSNTSGAGVAPTTSSDASASMMTMITPTQLREELSSQNITNVNSTLNNNNNNHNSVDSIPKGTGFGSPNNACTNISLPAADTMNQQKQVPIPKENISGESNKSDGYIFVPGPFDVIMGRGRHNKKKPGNRKLNQLLESYAAEYEASDKFQKTVMSEIVVSKMHQDGSRFLVREGDKKHGVWVEVSLEKARDKVAHDFRNLRRNAKLAKEKSAAEAAVVSSANSPSSSALIMDSSANSTTSSSKRRRSMKTSTKYDSEHDSKRTHGILEQMGT